jgi:PAS domain-containing protein
LRNGELPFRELLNALVGTSTEESGSVRPARGLRLMPGARRTTLRDGEPLFRQLLDVLPAAVYTTDSEGRITFFNDAATDLWGCRPTLGKNEWCGSWRLYWPDGRPMRHDECPMAVALKEGRRGGGCRAAGRDTRPVPCVSEARYGTGQAR